MKSLIALLIFASCITAGEKAPMPTLPASSPVLNGDGVKILGPVLSQSAPASATDPVIVAAGRFFAFTPADGTPSYIAPNESFRVYTMPPGSVFTGIKFDAPADAEPEPYSWPNEKGPVYVLLARNRPGVHSIQLVKNGPAETGPIANGKPVLVKIGQGPQPPPKPVDPVDPVIPEVKTFRAIFVKESGTNLPLAQNSIPSARVIREYLDAKTTKEGGTSGWREYDPQQQTTNEQPVMKAMWQAAKEKITKIPCMVVEVNGKVEIIPWPKDTDDALETLKKYGGK